MVFPLLLMIFFVTVEFSWMLYIRHSLENAAREGARAAIVPDASSDEVAEAVEGAIGRNGLEGMSYSYALKSGTGTVASPAFVASGSPVIIEVTAPWSQFSLLSTGWSMWTSDVTASAQMRREG